MTNKKFIIVIFAGLMTITTLVIFFNLNKTNPHFKTFPENTSIAGLDISGKTVNEARKTVKDHIEKYLDSETEFKLLGKSKKIKNRDLGIVILGNETVNSLKEAKSQNTSFIISLDREIFFETLDKNFEYKKLEPKSAIFYFDEKKDLSIKEGENGIIIREKELIKGVKNSARTLTVKNFSITTQNAYPPLTKSVLEQDREKIGQALEHEFVLIDPVYTDDWELKLRDHLDWVEFVAKKEIEIPLINETILIDASPQIAGKNLITIEINEKGLNEFIDAKISKWLDRPAEPVKIYNDKQGKVFIEGKGNNGKMIQRKKLKKAIEIALKEKIRNIPIPVVDLEPTIEISPDLQAKGIKERLAIGHTSYYGSPSNRIHNIKVGASKFNGLIIPPDGVFSFNKNLGPVDASTGFKKELVIKQEGTLPEFGGGICQVSTTMYRATLLAGLPTVERNQHSYAVSYYSQILGHGLDATIYLGGPDFKFKNDTLNHILIQTYTEKDYELFIVFYGTKDGRSTELEGPYLSNYKNPGGTVYTETEDLPEGEKKQIEKPHTGFNALWYRYITTSQGETIKEEIKTHYKSIPAKILVGKKKTATPAPPAAP